MTAPIDLDKLAALARGATQGPWRSGLGQDGSSYTSTTPIVECGSPDDPMTIADGLLEDDAAFIAACSPDAILALIDRVREAERRLPDGMEECFIEFRECPQGHGRLTATNWLDHGCPHCENARLRESLQRAEKVVEAARDVANDADADWRQHRGHTQNTRQGSIGRLVLALDASQPATERCEHGQRECSICDIRDLRVPADRHISQSEEGTDAR